MKTIKKIQEEVAKEAGCNSWFEAQHTARHENGISLQQTDVICRTCHNCGHRKGSFKWGKCMLSGYLCETERKFPSVCGMDFKGWIPRPKSKGIKGWLLSLWYGS